MTHQNDVENVSPILAFRRFPSPIGLLTAVASERGLRALQWEGASDEGLEEATDHPVLHQVVEQLGAYFSGVLTRFDILLDLQGTIFQKQVWNLLREIPYGETRSYGELAVELGDAKKVRAVGLANGRNPVPIVVPCHRVIGKSGDLIGFGGGIEVKAFLLRLEQQHRQPDLFFSFEKSQAVQ
ncbi:MAG: methylated-DNA--[protein]-cysteine S-methyltransferase [bacterium]|nr:methylated-DNA--[protein]-cysteine S-methyltransferase [bacterium]